MGRLCVPLALFGFALTACSRREAPPTPAAAASNEAVTTHSGMLDLAGGDAAAPSTAPSSHPRSLAGKKVLHVGDSMVGGNLGLTRALEAKLNEEGAKLVRHTQVSESLTSFDKSQTLRDLLRTHDPDIVIINLGANDARVPFPAGYAHNVEKITKRVVSGDSRRPSGRECWWIGPPSWKGRDTGIVSVIRDNIGRCHFFDSSTLELDRTADGIHPNERGAAKWADAFWEVFRDAS